MIFWLLDFGAWLFRSLNNQEILNLLLTVHQTNLQTSQQVSDCLLSERHTQAKQACMHIEIGNYPFISERVLNLFLITGPHILGMRPSWMGLPRSISTFGSGSLFRLRC